MPAHKWTFKSRFRANAYGWKGSALATKRLKEAVSEIKQVAKSEPVTAADGAIGLMERIWPALQGIDSSSGSLGNAVRRTLETLIPLVIEAPADKKTRRQWLDRLYEAICEDGQTRRCTGIRSSTTLRTSNDSPSAGCWASCLPRGKGS